MNVERYVLAHEHAAGIEGLVPLQTEIAALDLAGEFDAANHLAPGALDWIAEFGVESNGFGNTVNRQITGKLVLLAAGLGDLG